MGCCAGSALRGNNETFSSQITEYIELWYRRGRRGWEDLNAGRPYTCGFAANAGIGFGSKESHVLISHPVFLISRCL
jgi:hypothetical protein